MSNFTGNVSFSGSFVALNGFPSKPIFNPGVYEDRRNSFQASRKPQDIFRWRQRYVGRKKRKFTTAQIDAYADEAVKLTAAISAKNTTCRLAPLRGVSRPFMLVEVMSGGTVNFEFFDFRNGSKGGRDREISVELIAILKRTNPHTELFPIQIVDTAKGGQGINKLVSLLRYIHDDSGTFRNQYWSIDIHLLHPTDGNENIDNIRSVELNRSSKFEVSNLQLYPVPIVVGEDFDEASNFDFVRDGDLFVPRPRALGAGFLMNDQEGEQLIETDNVFLTLDEFFSEAITHSLLADPNRALAKSAGQKMSF
jgi:hypothetical protein